MHNQNPFIIKEAISSVKGFNRRSNEGNDFVINNNGEKIYSSLTGMQTSTIFLVVVFFMLIIVARLFYLQIIHGSDYGIIAEENRIRTEKITAERGLIYDRYNNPLVMNEPYFSLVFIPADLPRDSREINMLATQLSSIISKDKTELIKLFEESSPLSYKMETVVDNLTHNEAIALKIVEDKLPSIRVLTEPRRKYLENSSLAHVIGYIGKINQAELKSSTPGEYTQNDYIGKNGIEVYYEDILKGKAGSKQIEVDALGKPKKILASSDPQVGNSIVLTIDLELQQKLTQALKDAIEQAPESKGGAAVAIDPRSGEILALVSLPDFDNNFFSAGIQQDAYQNYLTNPAKPLFNRAISGTYPPGSTFKPIVALAALEEGIININKTFLSTGGLRINQWFFPDWKAGGHGRINVVKAIAESVNTFFYYIGGGYSNFPGLGVDKIVSYATKFYLNQKLGIDLPGEATGFLPSKKWKEEYKGEPWYIGDTYHLAIGQGDILVTPLQIATYTAAIANGGTLYQPHLLKEVQSKNIDNNFSELIDKDYILKDNFISPSNIEIMRDSLRKVVTDGSARSLSYLSTQVAGKTGTAQVGGDRETHAWFTGFAPFDSPSIVITILVENGGEGSSVAVPIFRDIIKWYFSDN